MGCARDIVEHVGVPRFLFSDFPLGNSAGKPFDDASQRETLALALALFESATGPRTTVVSPQTLGRDARWKDDYLNIDAMPADELARRRAEFAQQKDSGAAHPRRRPMSTLPRTAFTMVQTAVRTLEPATFRSRTSTTIRRSFASKRAASAAPTTSSSKVSCARRCRWCRATNRSDRIAKIGDRAARRWKVDVGDRVAVETMLSCRHCGPCLSGSYHLCDTRRIYSYIPLSEPPGLWGAYAQYMYLAPNTIVHRVDPTLPPQVAVMFNPLGAGFRWAVEMPNTRPGDSVVVLGPGQRGLACVVACREVGAGTIIVTGLAADANKLALARVFGADHTIDVDNEDAIARVKEITNGRGADIVVDVSSYATKPVADAMSMVRPGGTVVLAGVKGFKAVDNFVSDLIVMKEIEIKGAIGVTSSGYKAAIRLIESGRVPIAQMHTHDFDLADATARDPHARTAGARR